MLLFRTRQNERSNPQRLVHAHPDEHEVLLVETGRGRQLIGDQDVPCGPGQIYLFPPHSRHHSYCRPGEAFEALLVFCRGHDLADGDRGDGGRSLLDHLSAVVPAGGRLEPGGPVRSRVRHLFAAALAEQQDARPGAASAVRTLVTSALLALVRDARVGGSVAQDPDADAGAAHVDRAFAYLVRHADLPLRVEDLLPLGPLGRSRFLAVFKTRTGTTVGGALLAERLVRAKALLQEGDQPLVAVALACGFASQSHLTHRFTAAVGLAPGAWRAAKKAANPG